MNVLARHKLTVDEFLVASESWEGRWELVDGEPLEMQAENLAHVQIKFAVATALADAIRRAKLPCEALMDGIAVRISITTAFIPDATVRCGPRLPGDTLEIPDPLVVVEVVSPSSGARDFGAKVDGYFSIPSVHHYLVIVPDLRRIVHFRRGQGDVVERRLVAAGALRLDPPGLDLDLAALFPPA